MKSRTSTTELLPDTRGSLDSVRLQGDTLCLDGWAASADSGPVVDYRVFLGDDICAVCEKALGLCSPDVAAVFPQLDHSGQARFSLRVALSETQRLRLGNSVVTLEPLLSHGVKGRPMRHVVDSVVPHPPAELVTLIGSGFADVAFELMDYFVQCGGLRPNDRVLDVGCGLGRMAYALVHYLSAEGQFEGFDIVPELIHWAQREIGGRFPNFRFQHVPIYNQHYNPTGTVAATEFRFPYPDQAFDFVLLTSVFTHMQGAEVRHYLDEIQRVLRPGGRCVCTCFLLNAEAQALMSEGQCARPLVHALDDGYVADPANPEQAIGFQEQAFQAWCAARGLIWRQTGYGNWCGRRQAVSYQDLVVLENDRSEPIQARCASECILIAQDALAGASSS